jgi:hypothetical protein
MPSRINVSVSAMPSRSDPAASCYVRARSEASSSSRWQASSGSVSDQAARIRVRTWSRADGGVELDGAGVDVKLREHLAAGVRGPSGVRPTPPLARGYRPAARCESLGTASPSRVRAGPACVTRHFGEKEVSRYLPAA